MVLCPDFLEIRDFNVDFHGFSLSTWFMGMPACSLCGTDSGHTSPSSLLTKDMGTVTRLECAPLSMYGGPNSLTSQLMKSEMWRFSCAKRNGAKRSARKPSQKLRISGVKELKDFGSPHMYWGHSHLVTLDMGMYAHIIDGGRVQDGLSILKRERQMPIISSSPMSSYLHSPIPIEMLFKLFKSWGQAKLIPESLAAMCCYKVHSDLNRW